MRLNVPIKAKAGIRVHKSDLFVRDFYERKWPVIRTVAIITYIILIGALTLCLR